MFLPGTKVMVIAGGVKKSSGPRIGSLGYFIDCQEGHYFPENNCYAAPARVAFVRYGFEEKKRFEIKEFIFFVPVKKDDTSKSKAYRKWASRILDNIDSKASLDIAMNYSGNSTKSTYYGVLAPVTEDLDKLDELEWTVWLTSVVISTYISHLTSNLCSPNGLQYFRPNYPLEGDWHNTLLMLSNDKDFRKTTIKTLYESNRKEAVEAIRAIMAVAFRCHFYNTYMQFRSNTSGGSIRFRDGDLGRSTRAVQAVVSFLFTPLLADVKEVMRTSGRRELAMLAKNMDLWRSTSKAKAREVVCSPPGVGL